MPTYKIRQKSTGKTFVIKAKTEKSPEELATIIGGNTPSPMGMLQRGAQAVAETPERIAPALPIAGSIAGGMVVPGIAKGVGLGIAGRGAGEQLKQELQASPVRGMGRVAEAVAPGIGGLAGFAQPQVQPEQTREAIQETVKAVPMEIGAGVVGGLAGQALRAFRPLGKKATLQATKDVAGELSSVQRELGRNITKIIDDYPETAINIKSTNQALKELPDNVISYIRKNADIYDVKFLPNGSPVTTLRNMQNLKTAVSDYVTSPKQWEMHTKQQIGKIKGVYRKLRDIMVEAQPALKEPLKAYHNYINDVYNYVKPIVKTSGGQIKEKSLRAAMRGGADIGKREALESLAKLSDKAKQALQVVQSSVRRETAKGLVKRYAPYGLIGAGGVGAGVYGARKFGE
jgi:hypothetical protein